MKTKIAVLTSILILVCHSCEKMNNEINIDSLVNTKWVLTKIIDNNIGNITEFPEGIDNLYIVFKKAGDIELTGFCNFSYGEYNLTYTDSLEIINIGPSTLMYCLPELLMDWEIIFACNFPASKTFTISQNQLTINCDSEYNLVFDFVEIYNLKQGKVLFCTNSPLINCVFNIEISINNKIVDTLNAGSVFENLDCECENTLNTGLMINLESGEYNFSANELNCIATNKVNSWDGNITVIADSCSVIFLDIIKE